jgi:hypothetical protein
VTKPYDLPKWIVVSEREAARNQIIGAIGMYQRGWYDCAITLAGAAEDSLPDHPRSARDALLTQIRRVAVPAEIADAFYAVFDRKGDWMNDILNWLKHDKKRRPAIEIYRIDAEMMIFRAITKLDEPLWRLESESQMIAWFLKQMTENAMRYAASRG